MGTRRGQVVGRVDSRRTPSAACSRPGPAVAAAQLLAVGVLAATAGRDRAARSVPDRRSRTRLRPVSGTRARTGCTICSVRGRNACRSTSRSSNATTRGPTRASASCSTARQRCRCPRTCWSRTRERRRARRSSRSTGTARASRWSAASIAGATTCAPRSAEYHGDYAHQLACRGFVVLAPDLRGFGERTDWNPPDRYECDWNLVSATMAGASPLTQNLWDLRCSLDVLAQHPLVDPQRIGAAGLSYGGTGTLFLAAIDDRVKAAVVSGYFSSWAAAHRVPWNMCGSQVLPDLLGGLEHVDLGALDRAPCAARGDGHRGCDLPRRCRTRVDDDVGARVRLARRARSARARCVRGRSPVAWWAGVPVPRTRALNHGARRYGSNRRSTRVSKRSACGSPARTLRTTRSTPWSCTANRARTSGQLPRGLDGRLVHPGIVGGTIDVEQGAEAARAGAR